MGFAKIREKETPKPRYKNTIVCPNCHAEYGKNLNFTRGVDISEGTEATTILPLTNIPANECPICYRGK